MLKTLPGRMVSNRWRGRLLLAALFAICLCATYWRDPNLYRYPAAPYEDGRDVFGFFYNHPEPGSILRSYNGYISLIPNVAGYLTARSAVTRIPFLLVAFPLCVAALGFAWFAHAAYRGVVESDRLRWLAGLSLCLAPLGNYMFVSSTTYSVWNLLFVLILLSLLEPPRTGLGLALRLALAIPLICTHPLSIALVPVWWLSVWIVRNRSIVQWAYAGALTGAAAGYQLMGVVHAEASPLDVLKLVRVTGVLLVERVFFNTLLSDRLSRALYNQEDSGTVYAIGTLLALAVVSTLFLLRKRLDLRQRVTAGALLYLIVSLTVLYVVGRSGSLDILTGNPGYRYFWVQRLCLILLLFLMVDATLRGLRRRAAILSGLALAAVLVGGLGWLNTVDNHKYRGRQGMGLKLARFTERVRRQEESGDGAVSAQLERGAWSIELERPAAASDD